MTRHRAAITASLAAVLALGPLSACSDGDGNNGSAPDTPTFTEDTGTGNTGTDARETVTETVTTEAGDPSDASEPDPADGRITVSASGSGPVALTTDDSPEGEAESISGRLVTGQGSCFAVVGFSDDGPPRPLVVPADADVVTQDGRPSVTLPGRDTVYVGQPMDLEATTVPISDLEGVPDRCASGDSRDALVAN
ncbi:hypothetical protein [Corynebacterium glyciniphilum]|uniref:hypothetical protein n=1 Tax=Corynebacterium glyciniphilum TaxID=1404244 RepID=UPI0011AB3204|nr:hypothetical protein [Corynebacterium glyciniphilum]